MSDEKLIARLRNGNCDSWLSLEALLREAADAIERLTADLAIANERGDGFRTLVKEDTIEHERLVVADSIVRDLAARAWPGDGKATTYGRARAYVAGAPVVSRDYLKEAAQVNAEPVHTDWCALHFGHRGCDCAVPAREVTEADPGREEKPPDREFECPMCGETYKRGHVCREVGADTIEAATRVMYAAMHTSPGPGNPTFEQLRKGTQEWYRAGAEAVLDAAGVPQQTDAPTRVFVCDPDDEDSDGAADWRDSPFDEVVAKMAERYTDGRADKPYVVIEVTEKRRQPLPYASTPRVGNDSTPGPRCAND